jgi:hypothetical protein
VFATPCDWDDRLHTTADGQEEAAELTESGLRKAHGYTHPHPIVKAVVQKWCSWRMHTYLIGVSKVNVTFKSCGTFLAARLLPIFIYSILIRSCIEYD